MRTRTIQRGLELTELGLGTSQLGNLFRVTTDVETVATVCAAWNAGIRHFDTAPHYGLGLSERRLGAELRRRARDEYVLSTKVGRLLVPSPETAGDADLEGFEVPADLKRMWDFSRDGILRSVEASLQRLDIDRIDILYLHDPDNHFEQASTEGVGALVELREQGVVGAVGAGMNDASLLAELIRRADIDLAMCAGRFTLLDHGAMTDLLPLALERGVGVVAAGVYNSGLLSTSRPSPGARFDYRPAPGDLVARAGVIAEICERHGVTLPEAAVAFVLHHPSVVSVILGARGTEQVLSNVDRAAASVPDALWEELVDEGLIPQASA